MAIKKNKSSLLGLGCAIFIALMSQAYAAPSIQTWKTSNGAKVFFVEAHNLPMVDIEVVFNAGGARDENQGGIANLVNSLLDDGAGAWNADQIANRFEDIGAEFGTSSHRDMAVMILRSLTDEALLDQGVTTFATLIKKPTFPQESLERERNQMLIALQSQKQSPGALAGKAFFKQVYADHPYATPVLGSEESLNKLTRKDLKKFHQRYYVARNAVIAIVGDLSRLEAEKRVQQLIGDLPSGDPVSTLVAVKNLTTSQLVHVDHPSTQTHILKGQPGITRDDPDYFPLYVGNHVLGGSGLVSRISEEIREKRGFSYSAYSYFSPMQAAGPFTMGLQTKNTQVQEALTVLNNTVSEFIDNGPTDEELTASKQNITGGFPLRLSSNKKIVGNIASIGFYGLPLDYLNTFIDRVNAVTKAQIKDAFKRRINLDKMVTITVGQTPSEK